MKRRRSLLGLALIAVAAVAALTISSAASASSQVTLPTQFNIKQSVKAKSLPKAEFLRTTSFAPTPAKAIAKATTSYRSKPEVPSPQSKGKAPSAPADFATVPSLPIGPTPAGVMHKTGVTGYDQERFGGYALEPPDSEICAGNGNVIQTVNQEMEVWDQAGHELSPPMALEYFFSDFTNILTDPKCYWDPDTQHFFLTDLAYALGAGDVVLGSGVYIAVSQTGNPLGNWNIYFIDLSDPFGNTDCPCLADQPLLGADKWSLQISTNEYQSDVFSTGEFNGAGYFLIDKTALALGLPSPNVVGIDFGDISTPDGTCVGDGACWYSVQPAESPNANYDLHANGTSLAMSALDFFGGLDNRVALWLFTNTKTISSFAPVIFLDEATVGTGTYGNPPPGVQPSGYNPSGFFLWGANPFEVGPIETNDDRMNEVEYNYKTGWLMGGLNTGAYVNSHTHFRAAILTNAYKLQWFGNLLFITAAKPGYIANQTADVLFPASSTVNSGNGIWAYTLTGDSIYPSSAVSSFGNATKPAQILVANKGKGPEDGFCEYLGCPRWGDYSGASTDGNKVFWTSEFIDQTCTFAEYFADVTCGGTRGLYINWANSLDGAILP